MTPWTYRRKIQKKKKHKPHRKCAKCLKRMLGAVVRTETDDYYLRYRCIGCGWNYEAQWTGGGTGRHIPGESDGKA